MAMQRRRLLLGPAALAVMVLAFVLGRSGNMPGVSASREEAATPQLNFSAQDVVVRQTGDDGQLQYRLDADHVEQRPEDNQITATGLTVHYEAPGSQWKMTADRALLPDDGKLLQLRGAVQVTGQPPAASAPLSLTTDSLDYDLKTQDIRSLEIVDVRMGAQQLQGRGLHANIRLGTLELESQVNGLIAR